MLLKPQQPTDHLMGETPSSQKSHLTEALCRIGRRLPETLEPDCARPVELARAQHIERRSRLISGYAMLDELLADTRDTKALATAMDQRLGEALVGEQAPRLESIEECLDLFGRRLVLLQAATQIRPTVLAAGKPAERTSFEGEAHANGRPDPQAAASPPVAGPRGTTPKCSRTRFSIS